MPDGDEILEAQRTAWAGLAPGWEKWDSVIMDQLGPVSSAMIDGLDLAPGQQHLDIASGTGEPGLTIARLAPIGHVVLTDLSGAMLDVARRRAHVQGITNVDTQVCSADDLPFAAATVTRSAAPTESTNDPTSSRSPISKWRGRYTPRP